MTEEDFYEFPLQEPQPRLGARGGPPPLHRHRRQGVGLHEPTGAAGRGQDLCCPGQDLQVKYRNDFFSSQSAARTIIINIKVTFTTLYFKG